MYSLQISDLQRASELLGKSFNNYPIFEYILPDAADRKRKLKYFCRFLINLGMIKGEVIAPSNKIEGVSIWIHSTNSNTSGTDAIMAGFIKLVLQVNPPSVLRFMEMGNIKGKMRIQIVEGSYYYCDMIGVDPLLQGHGFGRRMIEAKLREFDKENVPCYLETSKVENVGYYEKFGFRIKQKYRIADVDVFCLLRPVDGRR
jgi:ribosomal protein S18 acetylase RimI-like enzyme